MGDGLVDGETDAVPIPSSRQAVHAVAPASPAIRGSARLGFRRQPRGGQQSIRRATSRDARSLGTIALLQPARRLARSIAGPGKEILRANGAGVLAISRCFSFSIPERWEGGKSSRAQSRAAGGRTCRRSHCPPPVFPDSDSFKVQHARPKCCDPESAARVAPMVVSRPA